MSIENFDEIIRRSMEIRKKYRELELLHHGVNGPWRRMRWLT